MDLTTILAILGLGLTLVGAVLAALQYSIGRKQLRHSREKLPSTNEIDAELVAENSLQPEPEIEFVTSLPSLTDYKAEGFDVLFDRFVTQVGEGKTIYDILATWNPDAGRGRPLIFITHFAADVSELLCAVSANICAMRAGVWRPAKHCWMLGEKIVNLDERRKQSTIAELGLEGWVLHGLLKAQPAELDDLRRALKHLTTQPPTLFFINLFGSEPETLLHLHVNRSSDDTTSIGRGIIEFCKWAENYGHRVVLCMPRVALMMESLDELARLFSESFITIDLFSRWPLYTGLEFPQNCFSRAPSLPEFLRSLMFTRSGALGKEIAAFFDTHAIDNSAADLAKEFHLAQLLSLAGHLTRAGFYEIAYRLELYCRTHRRTLNSISLDADLIRQAKREDGVVGLVNGVENVPSVVARALLIGDAGAGKTTTMLQIEEGWALPREAAEGHQHPNWLPFYLPLGKREGEDFEDKMRSEFDGNSKLQIEGAQEMSLAAHSLLARFASLNNIKWLFNSPILFLLDDIDRLPGEQIRVVEEGLHKLENSYPSVGVIIACQNQMLPAFKTKHQVHIRLLNERQIAALLKTTVDEPLHELLGVTSKAISYDIRNPFLLALLSEIREDADRIGHWNLYKIMKLFVERRVKLEPPAISMEITEGWLPNIALANKTRTQAGDASLTLAARHLLGRASEMGFLRLEAREGAVQFTHVLVEDFFAARALLQKIKREGVSSIECLLPDLSQPWHNWKYVLRMVAGGLAESLLCDFIQLVAKNDLRAAQLCLLELPVEEVWSLSGAKSIAGAVVERIETRNAGAHDVLDDDRIKQSISDAEALSFLDPRIRVDDPRAGLVEIKADDDSPPFSIGRYPVTNMEYAMFVADRGYQREEWWGQSARRWLEKTGIRHPLYWQHERLNRPNNPVVGVTFYEALAYCRWVSYKVSAGTGQQCSFGLPTEELWNRAVSLNSSVISRVVNRAKSRADSEQKDRQGEASVNAGDSIIFTEQDILEEVNSTIRMHLRQVRYAEVTPVGLFSPTETGCYDMLGGVWEWCDSWPSEVDLSSAPSTDERNRRLPVMVKGGPAEDEFRDILTIIGGWFDPYTRFHQIGFRVCCRPKWP